MVSPNLVFRPTARKQEPLVLDLWCAVAVGGNFIRFQVLRAREDRNQEFFRNMVFVDLRWVQNKKRIASRGQSPLDPEEIRKCADGLTRSAWRHILRETGPLCNILETVDTHLRRNSRRVERAAEGELHPVILGRAGIC